MIIPRVIVVEGSLEISSRDQVTGVVFFDLEGTQFPESTWNDSVVILLGWWLESLISLLDGGIEMAELIFMEGPLHVDVCCLQHGACAVKCVGVESESKLTSEFIVRDVDLLQAVYSAAVLVRNICQRKSWRSRDVDILCEQVDRAWSFLQPYGAMS